MAIINNKIKRYEDEMLYSWLYRLSKVNVINFKSFIKMLFGSVKTIKVNQRYNFIKVYEELNPSTSILDTFTSVSVFAYDVIFRKKIDQLRIVNNYFKDIDLINTIVDTYDEEYLYVCEECIKEDIDKYGEPYIHRAHQLNGVAVCYKHNKPLMRMECNISNLSEWSSDNPVYKRGVNDQVLAAFAVDLLEAKIDTCWEDVEKVIGVVDRPLSNMGRVLRLLYDVCCGDVEVLRSLISSDTVVDRCCEVLSELSVLRLCKFNNSECVVTTDLGLSAEYKYGCVKGDYQSRIENMFRCVGNGEYEVLSEFKSMNEPVWVKHRCGNVFAVKPRSFIYEGHRCVCNYEYSFEDVEGIIGGIGGYELLGFDGMGNPVRLKAVSCGHEFDVNLYKFVNKPYCRVCNPKTMDNTKYQKCLDELTDGKFELKSNYKDSLTKVKLKHLDCGGEFKVTPKYFSESPVCPLCGGVNNEKWDKAYEMLCKYVEINGDIDMPKRYVMDGFGIGEWCTKQRKYYSDGVLEKSRIKRLKDIGFKFDPKGDEWKTKFNLYKKYVKETDDIDIARRVEYKGVKLGVWVYRQRKMYKEGKISEKRYKLLSESGFKFE